LEKKGYEIGSHTVHHPDLTRIDALRARKEIDCSKKTIEDRIGKTVQCIAFPYGRFHGGVIDACRAAGYCHACGYWISSKDEKMHKSFVIERKACYLFDNLHAVRAKLGTNAWSSVENVKLRLISFCSHGSSLVKPSCFVRE
jgi:peptidoglycan/xylan/chitin deacetylase (PgdA/CDA1 family)